MARRLPDSMKRLVLSPSKGAGGPSLSPEENLAKCLEKAILRGDEPHTPSRAFHPSSMQCERNMFYQLKGVVQDDSDRTAQLVGICDSGTDRHLRLQKTIAGEYMSRMGWHYVDVEEFIRERGLTHLEVVSRAEMEVKLYDRARNVSFLTDGILKWDYDGRYYVLEIKTESSRKFYKRTGVDPKHYDQGTIYPLEFGLDTGTIFLYESRDDTGHKLFYFPVTQSMKDAKERQMAYVTDCAAHNELPPMPSESVREYACTYCPFKALCRLNHNGDGHIDPKYAEEDSGNA